MIVSQLQIPGNIFFLNFILCCTSLYQSWHLPWCWQSSPCGFPLKRWFSTLTSTKAGRVCQPQCSLQASSTWGQTQTTSCFTHPWKKASGIPTQAASGQPESSNNTSRWDSPVSSLRSVHHPRPGDGSLPHDQQPCSPQLRRSRALDLLNIVLKRDLKHVA